MGEAINLVNNFKVEIVIFNCGEFNDLEKNNRNIIFRMKQKLILLVMKKSLNKNELFYDILIMR